MDWLDVDHDRFANPVVLRQKLGIPESRGLDHLSRLTGLGLLKSTDAGNWKLVTCGR